jgi:hypothetical protein
VKSSKIGSRIYPAEISNQEMYRLRSLDNTFVEDEYGKILKESSNQEDLFAEAFFLDRDIRESIGNKDQQKLDMLMDSIRPNEGVPEELEPLHRAFEKLVGSPLFGGKFSAWNQLYKGAGTLSGAVEWLEDYWESHDFNGRKFGVREIEIFRRFVCGLQSGAREARDDEKARKKKAGGNLSTIKRGVMGLLEKYQSICCLRLELGVSNKTGGSHDISNIQYFRRRFLNLSRSNFKIFGRCLCYFFFIEFDKNRGYWLHSVILCQPDCCYYLDRLEEEICSYWVGSVTNGNGTAFSCRCLGQR